MGETTPSGLLDRLVTVLTLAERGEGATRATSLRLPDAVHEAAMLATELGMDPSLTAATSGALLDRVRRFVRTEALAGHLAAFPSDEPALADVALRRASGTEHPAASRPSSRSAFAPERERRWGAPKDAPPRSATRTRSRPRRSDAGRAAGGIETCDAEHP